MCVIQAYQLYVVRDENLVQACKFPSYELRAIKLPVMSMSRKLNITVSSAQTCQNQQDQSAVLTEPDRIFTSVESFWHPVGESQLANQNMRFYLKFTPAQ